MIFLSCFLVIRAEIAKVFDFQPQQVHIAFGGELTQKLNTNLTEILYKNKKKSQNSDQFMSHLDFKIIFVSSFS